MTEYVDVVALKPVGDYRVWVRFSNGREGVRDFADIIDAGGAMVDPLRDKALFQQVYLHRFVPAWPNGFEVDATNLHIEMDAAGLLTPRTVAAE